MFVPTRFTPAAFAAAIAVALAGLPRGALAIPYFAHEYGLTCQKCHSVIPRLNEFGLSFMDHGYALPGATAQAVFPLSMKFNLAYSSQPDPSGLPKGIVDEVELFLAGKMSPRTNYFIEQYVVDGGVPGAIREAWIANRFTPDSAKIPVYLQAGSFTLPLPVDPETLRETAQHYTLFDQTVGANPFNFFDPKNGIEVRAGYADHGLSIRLAALQGHDKQSGIPTLGLDQMLEAQQIFGPIMLAAYRYSGRRPAALAPDRFWRQGYGVIYTQGRWESDTILQTGYDGDFNGARRAALSSGGFTQLRYEFDRRLFALARYEGTCDPGRGFARDLVGELGYRVSRNSRFTAEDVVQHAGPTTNTLNLQYTAAY